MSKKNGKSIHGNQLVPSRVDDIELARALEERFLQLCQLHKNLKGEEILIPKSLDADMRRWRQMVVRYNGGDFRHTESELLSVKTIAQWTVDTKMNLLGREPKPVNWRH